MIPGLLAQDVAEALREFIVTGFETDTWPFKGKFEELVNSHNDGEAFIKGPYVSINLPFAKQKNASLNYFSSFATANSPYVHQQTSWDWLRSDRSPKSSIVATGTGSGKTECFLYPLLDHCLRNALPGIKAIVIYPMNALAGDQAKRFATVIHNTPELKGKVRVGLFIGGADETDQKRMGPEQVITCKKTLRKTPPDILLTNYKMLDYLLMRPKDQQLWKHNSADSLKYLVVDELHTFDGAQGSDLAMLIRRLKSRLEVKTKQLTCIGTSATLGSDLQMDDLANYASDIFDTHFDRNSIIGESRESQDDFISDILPNYDYLVLDREFTRAQLRPETYASTNDYLNAQLKLFFGEKSGIDLAKNDDRVRLGSLIKESPIFRDLLSIALKEQKVNGPATLNILLPAVLRHLPQELKAKPHEVLISMLSLLSHARGKRYSGEPFVTARLQLWARELRRIVARLGNDTPQFPVHLQFSDDLKADTGELYLPVVQCNECHSTAWLTRVEDGESRIEQDLRKIYSGFFSKDKQIRILLPLKNKNDKPPSKGVSKLLCVNCGELQTSEGACVFCQEEVMVPVFEPVLNKSVKRGGVPTLESQRMCPVCQASSSLLLFGARASSLSSVAIHQMFANPINDDKKLIAFSDSVQDAAHRAGFFAARTWQNNIRMALAKTITHYVSTENKPIALTEFFNYLPEYWMNNNKNADRLNPLNYITQFIPPNMQTNEDYMGLKASNDIENPGNLMGQINKRFIWEILNEFGIRSLMGRSLERTGVATLSWDVSLIESAASILQVHCSEQLGRELTTQQAEFMLWGVALRMKRQGAIFNKLLLGYIENGGDWYLLSRKNLSFMPDIGNYSVLPRFPGEISEKGLDRLLPNSHSNWYSRWVVQLVGGDELFDNHFIVDLLKLVMKSFVESGLVLPFETKKEHAVWALNPDKLYITTDLSSVKLQREIGSYNEAADEAEDETGAYGSWHIPADWEDSLIGLPSLDQVTHNDQHSVTYCIDAFPRQSMYKDFYLKGQINRVIGHEHTALLERDYREALEKRFMSKASDRKDWYENLLSATPTLEMGIDIGDLSSVLLCSVPPGQANYLQRAGRGGRRDGNSFVLTLANGHPHDLYFYADPVKMMAGDIQAPAIFLNASMVLKRQLLAFCFDRWGVNMKGQQVIPGSMQPVIDAVEKNNQKKFPYTLLEFISLRRDELWEGFLILLGDKVTDATKLRLKEYMLATSSDEDALHVHVLNRIQQVVGERNALISQQKDLDSALRALKNKPQDEARDELEKELNTELEGMKRLKSQLNWKKTLNFFTDDGLLPNYAFPEEGTTLHSVIYRRLKAPKETEDGKTTNYDSTAYEYSRPAHSALSELAPESIFYASNRKVQIDRVEMAKGENLEYWRLCPSCNYSEQILGIDQDIACPRCHDSMWSNTSQKIPMVRLTQVYASTSEADAFIGDDSDTREPTFFNRQMLIDFDPEDITEAYAMKTETKPFGFEFIKKASFKEINFGKQGGSDQVFHVAGQELARPGFRLCKECGTVQHKRNTAEHLYKCQFRNVKSAQGDEQPDAGIVECLYLYRQYESEAIRILMPRLSIADREEQLQSFVASLQLGLKARYGGKVDHLHIMISDEPIADTTDRASYLVIYDTVPGGTGYLHDLLKDPKNIMELLTLSQEIMASCSCQELPDVDGCYNCLYAYKNSYGMEHTSRSTALAMLAEILDENVELERVTHLGKISKNVWADSELESRFPEAIQELSKHKSLEGKRVRTSTDIINGKTGFKLEIGELIYTVEIHPRLGEADGVAYPCEPDFIITLDRESDSTLPIAVFLDGYRYHKNIVHEDLMKRQGIFLSRKYLTWSLTWYDINHVFAGSEAKIPNVFRENVENSNKGYIRQISESKGLLDHNEIAELNPLLMLLKYLSNPNKDIWKGYASLRTLSWLDQKTMQDESIISRLKSDTEAFPGQFMDKMSATKIIFSTINTFEDKSVSLKSYIAGGAEVVRNLNADELMLAVVYQANDSDTEVSKRTWQKLLQIMNLGQFLPNFFAGTESGIIDGSFSKLSWSGVTDRVVSTEWDSILTLADDNISDLLIEISRHDVEIPVVGFELEDENGAVEAEAELAWLSIKVALMMDYQLEENKTEFEKQGWLVFSNDTEIEIIIEKLRG